jgi:hypothetical protein
LVHSIGSAERFSDDVQIAPGGPSCRIFRRSSWESRR